MGWDVAFDGRFACQGAWLDRALVRPRVRLPVPLAWPPAPPKNAQVAPRWIARMSKPHGAIDVSATATELRVAGNVSEDGFREYFSVVIAMIGAGSSDGRLELAAMGGVDFACAIVAKRGALSVESVDTDATTERLFGIERPVASAALVHARLGVTRKDDARVRSLLAYVKRVPARRLGLGRDALGALAHPWDHSAAADAGELVSSALAAIARTAHEERWRDRAKIDAALVALVNESEAPFLRASGLVALASSDSPVVWQALVALDAATRHADPFALRSTLERVMKRSRVPKRSR